MRIPKPHTETRPQSLEWDKEASVRFQVRATDQLPAGVTLTGTPTVEVQKLTRYSEPKDWNEEASISVTGISIVDAYADDGVTLLAASQAVQFTLTADSDPQPDETDDPIPGDIYRVVAVATRSDAGEWPGKVPLVIHF